MKKLLLIITHYSQKNIFLDILNSNKRIQKIDLKLYKDINNIFMLDSIKNEYRKNPSFYMDSLFFNHQFSFSPLLDFCKFVYLIRKPRYIVPDLVEKKIYDYNSACSYYNFRLRKIYEMIIKTPKENQRVYFDDDFEKQDTYEDIKSYLNLKEGFKIKNAIDEPRSINSVFEICDKCYEKYRYKIKQGLR